MILTIRGTTLSSGISQIDIQYVSNAMDRIDLPEVAYFPWMPELTSENGVRVCWLKWWTDTF